MIKAIIFDCFGVLTSDKWKEFVRSLPEAEQEPARELNRAMDRGFLSPEDFVKQMHELTGLTSEQIMNAINPEQDKNISLLNYIRELRPKYKIGLLSNVSSNWIEESFLTTDEAKLFDALILSYEVGMIKPDVDLYKLAARRLSVNPEECIFIDDGPRNVEGAITAGMQGIHYEGVHRLRAAIEKFS